MSVSGSESGFLDRDRFAELIAVLSARGYRCVGPRVRDGAIQYLELQSAADLPAGWQDRQEPGRYRLEPVDSPRQFAWATGPQALKPFLFAPREVLWEAARSTTGELGFSAVQPAPGPLAIIGVRACDLAALRLQDAHFLDGAYRDAHYASRRAGLLLIAVNCTHPAATCFCVSTGDGPAVADAPAAPCDLVLDELDAGFVVHSVSDAGAAIAQQLNLDPVTAAHAAAIEDQHAAACAAQTRRLPGRDLRHPLYAAVDHARWSDVAERCLACGNCTSVCPTCFCHCDHDEAALDGSQSAHVREWDSCFTQGHSYIHGITIRADTRLRYRQWLTHKLAGWHDQYGRSGCVGCGRCISWCPVGIDITEEAAALAAPSP